MARQKENNELINSILEPLPLWVSNRLRRMDNQNWWEIRNEMLKHEHVIDVPFPGREMFVRLFGDTERGRVELECLDNLQAKGSLKEEENKTISDRVTESYEKLIEGVPTDRLRDEIQKNSSKVDVLSILKSQLGRTLLGNRKTQLDRQGPLDDINEKRQKEAKPKKDAARDACKKYMNENPDEKLHKTILYSIQIQLRKKYGEIPLSTLRGLVHAMLPAK